MPRPRRESCEQIAPLDHAWTPARCSSDYRPSGVRRVGDLLSAQSVGAGRALGDLLSRADWLLLDHPEADYVLDAGIGSSAPCIGGEDHPEGRRGADASYSGPGESDELTSRTGWRYVESRGVKVVRRPDEKPSSATWQGFSILPRGVYFAVRAA